MSDIPQFVPPNRKSAADIHGPWQDPGFDSGLIQRVRANWTVPIQELTNHLLATFLRQRIAIHLAVAEARKRLDAKTVDGSELYDEELFVALKDATMNVPE
ncbi:MAG TPA: hypothetical protein VHD36_11135 [Pirellulales bacterium]|nr:hypothetical protein [Pirellulales bacterium]